MIDIDNLKRQVKNLKIKDDFIVDYFKKSIAHSKDWADIVASVSVLNEHLKEKYNMIIVAIEK